MVGIEIIEKDEKGEEKPTGHPTTSRSVCIVAPFKKRPDKTRQDPEKERGKYQVIHANTDRLKYSTFKECLIRN